MQLICLSVTHHLTPLELRECLSLSVEAIERAAVDFPIRAGGSEEITEMAILSTCNRLEIYALVSLAEGGTESAETVFRPLLSYLDEAFGLSTDEVEVYFQSYTGIQVVEHLFQVAAGLDSIAIGETQILGQVSRALDTALRIGTARHVLSSLFRSAIHAGKRVRSETEIGRHPTSIAAIAIQHAEREFGTLEDKKVLVVGAGKMGACAVDALRQHAVRQILLTNRTNLHAIDLARQLKFDGEILPFEALASGIQEADLVFTSTAAPLPIIHHDLIQEVMARRAHRPLTFIDLAVPRNVEAKTVAIPGVRLFDMDDLQAYVKTAEASSHPDLASAKAIVDEEVAEYEKLLRIIPFIGELHKKVELIRQREVEKTLRYLRTSDPEVCERIEMLSRSLVRKILHEPTMHLRTETNQETLNEYVDTLGRLFDLSENEGSLSFQNGDSWER